MSDGLRHERIRMIREVRQRLEALGRAGLDRAPIPVATVPVVFPRSAATVAEPSAPDSTLIPAPAPAPVPSPPRRPVVPGAAKSMTATTLFGEPDLILPPVEPSERPAQLAALAAEVAVCTRCPHLAASRTQTVFGTGSPTARLMFVGEAPGADEDRTGQPFVGRAGALLTDMITKGMGLTRAEVYIANILKSRPPENRDPLPDEIAHCLPYLERQIAIVRPEFLCLLGRIAAQALLETSLSLNRLRGKWHRYRGIPTVVTFHPSYLLRNSHEKKRAWEDLQMLMQAMGLKPPSRRKS